PLAPPTGPPVTPAAGPSPGPPPGQPGPPPGARARSGIPMLAMTGILLGVIAIGGGYFVLNTRAADVTLEQANTQSPSAFDPSLTAAPSTTPSPTPSEATKPPPA